MDRPGRPRCRERVARAGAGERRPPTRAGRTPLRVCPGYEVRRFFRMKRACRLGGTLAVVLLGAVPGYAQELPPARSDAPSDAGEQSPAPGAAPFRPVVPPPWRSGLEAE